MSRSLRTGAVFLALIVISSLGGAFLQRAHAFLSLKRLLTGRPLQPSPPSEVLLRWERGLREARRPKYSLSELDFKSLESSRSPLIQEIERLLKLDEFPKDFSSTVRITERAELKKVFREKIELEVEPGLWVSFYLLIPKELPGPGAGILVLHSHSAGKIETAGILDSPQHKNALALAEAGFVTVAPDSRGFGESGWSGEWEDPIGHQYGKSIHVQDVQNNLLLGRTTLASFIYDLRKILVFLETRPEINPERIGATGLSMGADVALWLAMIEPRIKAVFASASPLLLYRRNPELDFGEYHICINTIPGIRKSFRRWELPLLAAPRPLFLNVYAGNSKIDPAIRPPLEKLYQEAGRPEALSFRIHTEGESYPNQLAIDWFKKWL